MINDQRFTWVAHAAITLGVGVAGQFFAPWGINGPLGFCSGATLMTLIYFAKEQHDELKHRLDKDYDRVDASGVTPRADKVGDLVGPVSITATAWTIFFLELFGA